ncbi:MAG: glycine betaine ABC transporter substrate-binding protein, partial [Lactovum sp.]
FLYQSRENTIYIGTKNLTEQQIMAHLYKQVIEEETDYKVRIISGLDTTAFVHQALMKGNIDFYLEYSSTAYLEIFKHDFNQQSNQEIINSLKKDYDSLGLSFHSLAGFENSNAIISSNFSKDLMTISDLSGKNFSFAAPAYFFEREDGYNLLSKNYDFSKVEIIKADPIIIYQGLLTGQIDVGLGFTTDAKLINQEIQVLVDSQSIFPSYEAFLVSTDNFDQDYPKVSKILEELSGEISTEEISYLNDQVENQKRDVEELISEFLDYQLEIKD